MIGCGPPSAPPSVMSVDGGAEVHGVNIERVEVKDTQGIPVVSRQAAGIDVVYLPLPAADISAVWTVDVIAAGVAWRGIPFERPAAPPVAVTVEAPMGQEVVTPGPDDRIDVPVVDGVNVQVGIVLTARSAQPVQIIAGEQVEHRMLRGPGHRVVVTLELAGEVLPITVEGSAWSMRFSLVPRVTSAGRARELLRVDQIRFPAQRDGSAMAGRSRDRVTLMAPWWHSLLVATGFGYRARDDQAPWAWVAVDLENRSSRATDLVIRNRVIDQGGIPSHAFRPQIREADVGTGDVAVRLRVPAQRTATATVPFWVDPTAISHSQEIAVAVEVLPLGSEHPLHRVDHSLHVTRGSGWSSGGFLVVLGSALIGWCVILLRGPRWLGSQPTSDLLTVALFGSLTFVVAAAAQLVGMGVAVVLGPFAPLLTGIVDDAFRITLLATLVSLLPRVGVVTLALLVGWALRGLTLSSFHPVDILYVGSASLWIEASLYVFGLTRLGTSWLETSRLRRWIRLSLGFGLGQVCAMGTGLVISAVLYRMFYATWYVALLLALPGFLYVCIAAWLAVGFAHSLRRVQA